MRDCKILSPCGILGYGYPLESFMEGIRRKPDAIVVDAGSTDAGPHKLGGGAKIVSRLSVKKDLIPMIIHGTALDIPVIIGSSGGSGTKDHVSWTVNIIREIMNEKDINKDITIIYSDIDKKIVVEALKDKKIEAMENVHPLTDDIINDTRCIVAQMGVEPIIEALEKGSRIIVCGRSYDPAIFAAVGIYKGFNPGLSYHLGKILECGALCAEPGTAKDCILGTLRDEDFLVEALNIKRKCTSLSVAAHTFYEKDHPYLLYGPGVIIDLSQSEFIEEKSGVVRVRGSKVTSTDKYLIKLEGARGVAYRTIVIAGIRDPIMISMISDIEEKVVLDVEGYYYEISKDDYRVNFYNYGMNGVLGDIEIALFNGHEIGIVIEVLGKTQDIANTICASIRSTLLHYPYEGRKSTSGNLAFPFAPSDIECGRVYEFSVYHLMEVENGLKHFTIVYGGEADDAI